MPTKTTYGKMGNPFKRGKSWTYICYPVDAKTGKPKAKWCGGFKTEKEAKDALRKAESEISAGSFVASSNLTVTQYVEKWFDYHRLTLKPNTINGYWNNIKNHIEPVLGNKRLSDIGKKEIVDFVEALKAKSLSPRSIQYARDVLKMALNDAVEDELLKKNPCLKVAIPKQKRYHAVVLDTEQAKVLLSAAIGSEIEFEVLTALSLGLRRGEVLGLKYSDFDFAKGTVHIQRQVTYVKTQAEKDNSKNKPVFALVDLKTDNADRILYLPKSIIDATQRRRKSIAKRQILAGELWKDNDLMCVSDDGNCHSPQTLYHRFKRMLKSTGLPNIRFHDLRHSCATLLLDMDVPLKVISNMLGHSTIAITADIYCDVLDKKKQVADIMETMIFTP